jgi:hypothetical protein
MSDMRPVICKNSRPPHTPQVYSSKDGEGLGPHAPILLDLDFGIIIKPQQMYRVLIDMLPIRLY